MKKSILGGLLTVLCPLVTSASEYTEFDKANSSINFQYEQMGVPMDGHFNEFTGSLTFDPAKPEAAQAEFNVALASVDAGSDEANDEVVGQTWFNATAFPQAQFKSTAVKALGENHYEVAGRLTIKGKSVDVTVPATFTETDGKGSFTGTFTIKRGDFSIGEGSWSTFDIVANDINVTFKLAANSSH